MGSGKRTLATAAIVLVCTAGLPGTPGAAYAIPGRPAAKPAPSGGSATASGRGLEAVRGALDKLYHDAAVATDAYDAAEEKAERQSARIVELARQAVKGRQKLAALKDRAGAAARAQYRGGGVPPEVRLWLSQDPQEFLDEAGIARQGEHAAEGLLAEMTRTQADLKRYASDAADQWQRLDSDRKAKDEARKNIERQIAAAEKLRSRLQRQEQEQLRKLEEAAAATAQTAWLDTGTLKEARGTASEAGEKAVRFATDQIGKPYVWGAAGPASYDCSGLTSQAWAAAGHPVPRTSQEQWKQLQHVDVKDMRPGDLIIYFPDASHVAMYVGDGAIVHAPRPGRPVTLAGAGSMPILGVVRPDTDR